jgi:hypothetical protein
LHYSVGQVSVETLCLSEAKHSMMSSDPFFVVVRT